MELPVIYRDYSHGNSLAVLIFNGNNLSMVLIPT
jgi:hypothetical protein